MRLLLSHTYKKNTDLAKTRRQFCANLVTSDPDVYVSIAVTKSRGSAVLREGFRPLIGTGHNIKDATSLLSSNIRDIYQGNPN